MTTTPLRRHVPLAPDADWETIRARVMEGLLERAPEQHSDHNAIDPGVTVAEAASFAIADLHYRASARSLAAWPLEVHAWEPREARHWHTALAVDDGQPGTVTDLAAHLAKERPAGTVAKVLEPLARRAASRSHAITLATEAGLVGAGPTQIPPAALDAAITATRARLVLQMALEHTGAVAAAVDAHDVLGGTRDERDAAAAQSLAASLPLWDEEREALVRRDRRRRVARTGVDFDSRLTSGEPDTDLPTDLAAAGMTAEEAAIARGRATTPPGAMPEDFEHPGGETEVWPPHPLQALACEPVTDDDYARRARAHSHVARAWAVGGRLAGVRWDGSEQTSAAPDALGAVTLVVERRARPDGLAATSWPTDRHFLREVLALAIGSEVHSPHPTWLDSYDPLDPRRLLCDEVGAAVLKRCAITLQGTLLAGPAVDQTALVAGVVSRLEAFFASGRPESRPAPLDAPAVDGPWPPHPQPLDGWIPGEPVRLTEVVQAIVADDAVLGVEGLALRAGTGPWVTEGAVELDPDCVPGDVDGECVRVRLVTTGECGHV